MVLSPWQGIGPAAILPVVEPARVSDLRAIRYFASLPDDDAARFSGEVSARKYHARELIALQGEPAHGFYYLRTGKARLFRTGPDGREQTLRLIAAGETFGEVPVMDNGAMPVTVEALEPSEVLLVPAGPFRRLMVSHPEVAQSLLTYFARRLRAFTEMVEAISLQTVQARLARYLYQLAREEGQETPDGILVPREITQQDLASLVGSVREVVSRTLKVMDEDGVVEVHRKAILIRDLAALKDLL
ncbi:MAG TPA: Crp/Fnr family transcriptional regulator [Gemmatimonadales bacterium]|nr:Crp/Fnr family transcriptional regulator [Gemmatimonadales bacterium]